MANQIMGVNVKRLASIVLGVAVLGVTAGLSGCGGSATNNDQGTSFLALNYTRVNADGTITDTVITSGTVSIYDSPEPTNAGFGLAAGFKVSNRLSAQYIRVDQISCSYEVPGSSVSLYQDSYNSSFVVTANGTGNLAFQLVSRDVLAYFANRVNQLPELPTRMNVSCYAVGISQSGDVFQTNPLNIQLILTDDTTFVDEVEEVPADAAATLEEFADDGDDTSDDEDTSPL